MYTIHNEFLPEAVEAGHGDAFFGLSLCLMLLLFSRDRLGQVSEVEPRPRLLSCSRNNKIMLIYYNI